MADASHEERTEAPSQKRRDEARRKGQVPRSAELSAAFVLLAAAGTLDAVGGGLARAMAEIFAASTTTAAAAPGFGMATTIEWIQAVGWKTMTAMMPLVLALAGTGVAVSALQARGVLTTEPLKPDWSRIAPTKNIGRIFGKKALIDLLKAAIKLAIIGAVVWMALEESWPEIVSLAQRSPFALLGTMQQVAVRLFTTVGLVFLALAGADYGYQVWEHEKGLRMTKEEVKQEHKEQEGDPLLKQRMRAQGRNLLRKRMFRDVPKADVVVTNPTHIAVALKYDPAVSAAPIVLAMGERKVAERIKKIAHESGVPVIRNVPLARALVATARIGQPIPVELYLAVAEVLAFVIRQRAARGPGWASQTLA